MNLDELAQEHEQDHPGYVLADWYEAAFPLWEVFLRVNFLERQPLQPVDEFVLRLLDAGVSGPQEMAHLLGLEAEMVIGALEQLERLSCVDITLIEHDHSTQEILVITKKGRSMLRELETKLPVEDSFNVCLDALTGAYEAHRRLRGRDYVQSSDVHAVPVWIDKPTLDQLDVVQLRRLWIEYRRTLPKELISRELIDVVALQLTVVRCTSARPEPEWP